MSDQREKDNIKGRWNTDGLKGVLKEKDEGFLEIGEALSILEKGPFDLPNWKIIDSEEDLNDINTFPVVLKAADKDLVHKTESGGVKLGISTREDLLKEFRLMKNISKKVLVMDQVSGTEFIMGAVRDPVFGPVIMFGLGGTMVEVLEDIVFRVGPLSRKDAYDLLEGIRSSKLLDGVRGKEPADKEKLADLLLSLSELMMKVDDIDEIEINPLMLTDDGAIAVDARVKLI